MSWKLTQADLNALAKTDIDKKAPNLLKGLINKSYPTKTDFKTAVEGALKTLTPATKKEKAVTQVVAHVESRPSEEVAWELLDEDLDALEAGGLDEEAIQLLDDLVQQPADDEAAFKTAVEAALKTLSKDKDKAIKAVVAQVKKRVGAAPKPSTDEPKPAPTPNTVEDPEEAEKDEEAAPKVGTMFSAALSAEYSRRWGFDMTASSKVTATLIAIPPPEALIARLQEAQAGERLLDAEEET